jgi:urease accessory protein
MPHAVVAETALNVGGKYELMTELTIGTAVKQAGHFDFAERNSGFAGSREAYDNEGLAAVRSRGEIRLGFRMSEGRTAVSTGYQSGCLRFRIPRTAKLDAPVAVLLNTSGGLAGGDRLVQQVSWDSDTRASVTSQAAEKVYRALHESAVIDTRLTLDADADAEWMPQETILFDRARLRRDMQVRLADTSSFLGIEAVVLGRTAMDETMRTGSLVDRWRIWRGGKLIYADALRIEGAIDDQMQRSAVGAGARAMAVIIHVSSRAASLLNDVREALVGAIGLAAASCWNGMLVTRFLARNGAILRHDMLRALSVLRGGRAMPRVWSC